MRRAIAVFLFVYVGASAALADEGWVTHAIALSPNKETVVRGRMHAEKGTSPPRIEDARNGTIRHELRGPGPIRSFAFRGDSARFVVSNDHGPPQVRGTATGRILVELAGHKGWVYSVSFAGERIAWAGRDGTVRVWNARNGTQLWSKKDEAGTVMLSPNGTTVAPFARSRPDRPRSHYFSGISISALASRTARVTSPAAVTTIL